MKKYITLLAALSSVIIISSLSTVSSFADTTATGTTATGTTAIGTTATGTSSTGVTATGVTATGTTATGTSSTGVTATGVTATGNHCATATGIRADHMAAQQAFLVEMTRLINEKGTAYTAALSLSGSLKTDAIKVANVKFRAGIKVAIKNRETAKLANKLAIFTGKMECKKERKDEKKDRQEKKHEEKNEMKHQIKELQKSIKAIKKAYRSNHKNR